MRIDNWGLLQLGSLFNPVAPTTNMCLCSDVVRVKGESLLSSVIVGKHNGKVITKSGSEYELGIVNEEYEAAFPRLRENTYGVTS